MTKKELIKAIKQYPDNTNIFIGNKGKVYSWINKVKIEKVDHKIRINGPTIATEDAIILV